MQNNKKWLAVGGGLLVVLALIAAVTLNQGGLFKGNLYSSRDSIGYGAVDLTEQIRASGQTAEHFLFSVVGDDKLTYDIMGDATLARSGVYSFSDNGLTINAETAKRATTDGTLYFKVQEQLVVNELRQVMNIDSALPTDITAVPMEEKYLMVDPAVEAASSYEFTKSTAVEAAMDTYTLETPVDPYTMELAPSTTTTTTTTTTESAPLRSVTTTDAIAPSASLIPRAHAEVSNIIEATADSSGNLSFKPGDYPNGKYTLNITLSGGAKLPPLSIEILGSLCSDVDQFGFDPTTINYDVNTPSGPVNVKIFGINEGAPILKPGTPDYETPENFCNQSLKNLFGVPPKITVLLAEKGSPANFVTVNYTNAAIWGGFADFATFDASSKYSFPLDFTKLDVGGTIGTINPTQGKTYNFSFESSKPGFSKPIEITLTKGAVAPKIDVGASIIGTPSSQNFIKGQMPVDALGVAFRNVSGVDQVIKDITFTGLIKADAAGDFQEGTDTSASAALKDVVLQYQISKDAATVSSVSSIDSLGNITFKNVNFLLPANPPDGPTTIILFSGMEVHDLAVFPNDVQFKYVLKDVTFASPTTVLENKANVNNTVIMTLPAGPVAAANMFVYAGGDSKTLKPGDKNVNVLSLNFRNITGAPQKITSITFGALIKGDAIGDYEQTRDVSANVQATDMIKNYNLDSDPGKKRGLDPSNGELKFESLNLIVPAAGDPNKLFVLLNAESINKLNENGRRALQNDTLFKYFVKSITFEDATVVVENQASVKSPGLPVMTELKDCISLDKFMFVPAKLTYDENSPKSPQDTDLSAFSGTADLGIPFDGACTVDMEKAGLGGEVPAFYLELTDGVNVIASETVMIDGNGGPPFPKSALEKYITMSLVYADGKPVDMSKPVTSPVYLRFTTKVDQKDFTISGKSLEYNKLYSVVLWGTTVIDKTQPVTGKNVQKNAKPVDRYQVTLVPKKGAPAVPPAVQPVVTPVKSGDTYITNNTYTTTTAPAASTITTPSTVPCLVNGKTFYLAQGPNSAYCKDLQDAGVAQVDQPAEIKTVRYVNALTALRVSKDLGGIVRTKNIPADWYNKFEDGDQLESVTASELADFRTVYATGILTGRVDPRDNSMITLAPLDEVSYIEGLSTYQHTIENAMGISVQYDPNNVPSDILQEYKNNPDWKWIVEAYSFGVKYNMITKNQYNKNSIFNISTRGELVNTIAKFKLAIKANPSLIGK